MRFNITSVGRGAFALANMLPPPNGAAFHSENGNMLHFKQNISN
jgi:hypothetical protein